MYGTFFPLRTFIPLFFLLALFSFLAERKGSAAPLICDGGTSPAIVTLVGALLIGSGAVWDEIIADQYNSTIIGTYQTLFKKSDTVFANFEGIISGDTQPRSKGLPPQFSLRTDPSVVRFLGNFGSLILSFANNHSADYGEIGIKNALAVLRESGIAYIGIGENLQSALSPVVKDVSGVRIGFLAFTDLLPEDSYATETRLGVAKLSVENLRMALMATKESSDFVIVSLHTTADVRQAYSFWPDAHQVEYARIAIDNGADMVVGQHPHGLQSVEVYKGKVILHSLGLFMYDPAVSEKYTTSDPLLSGTRFEGGAVAKAEICQGGLRNLSLFPSRVTKRDNRLMVVPDNSLITFLKVSFIRLRLFLLL